MSVHGVNVNGTVEYTPNGCLNAVMVFIYLPIVHASEYEHHEHLKFKL